MQYASTFTREVNDVNNVYYLVTLVQFKVWDVLQKKQTVPIVSMLDTGEMGRCKDLHDFDKGQMVMAR